MTGFNSKRLASKDSLKQAIDTLDAVMHPSEKTQRAITALRTALRSALAQPAAPVPAVLPDLVHKPTVQNLMDLARQFRSTPGDLYDSAYKTLQDACYAALAAQPTPVPEEHDMDDDGGFPVCGADGGTSCGMPNCGLLSAAPAVQSAARAIAAEQAEDAGLWFVATTVTEAHLQAALRRLTAAVEGAAP
jgi:hypothetical protein